MPRERIRIRINEELCKGCNYCIEFCPKGALERSDEANQKGVAPPHMKDDSECIGCGLCILLCPDLAMDEEREGFG